MPRFEKKAGRNGRTWLVRAFPGLLLDGLALTLLQVRQAGKFENMVFVPARQQGEMKADESIVIYAEEQL